MLIDYAINYYCWPRLQAFILLRMYGCGCSIDLDFEIAQSVSGLSVHMLQVFVKCVGPLVSGLFYMLLCLTVYITVLTVA